METDLWIISHFVLYTSLKSVWLQGCKLFQNTCIAYDKQWLSADVT
jgi:hypothetical protein